MTIHSLSQLHFEPFGGGATELAAGANHEHVTSLLQIDREWHVLMRCVWVVHAP